jgi:TRAP-type mannitol/chloroaromatic compound transport system permease small subunit
MSAPDERFAWLRWIDKLSVAAAVVGGIATVGLMVHVVADVGGRALANRPLAGTLDVTQTAWMPTLIALGMGYALQRSEHIRVSLMTAPAGPRTQRLVEIGAMATTLVVIALFIWFGVGDAQHSMSIGERAVGASWLSVWPFRWIVTLGLMVLLLQTVASLVRAATDPEFAIEDDVEAAMGAEDSVFDELEATTALDSAPRGTERNDAR